MTGSWRAEARPARDFTVAALAGDSASLAGYLDLLARDALDPTVVRLLPLARRLAVRDLADHPALPLLAGMHRKAHMRNTFLLHRAGVVAGLLAVAGLPVVALKGVALLATYYPDAGARPMSDADLLLPPDAQVDQVDRIVAAAGLRRISAQVHAWTYVDDAGLEYDLHRYLAPALAYDGARDVPGVVAEGVTLGRFRAATLDAEGHVSHCLVHSTSWNTSTPVRWIPDIALVAAGTPDLDWDRVAGSLTRWGWSGAGAERVEFLHEVGLVSDEAVAALGGTAPDGWLDSWVQDAAQGDPRSAPARHVVHRLVALPLRLARRSGSVSRWSYRRYVRDMWALDPDASLARAGWRRLGARVRYGSELPVLRDAQTPRRGSTVSGQSPQ